MGLEQARGGAVDKRADIWAFGVVLFERLSGRSLFAAETVTDTLAGVLKSGIDFSALPPSTPTAVRQLLRRCLERNPKDRLHDAADARLVLADLEAGIAGETPAVPAPLPRGTRREVVARALAATAALVAAAVVLGRGAERPVAPRVIRATHPLPAGVSIERDRSGRRLGELGTPGNLSGFGGLALSRDGRWAAVGRVDEAQSDADIGLYDVVRGTETRLARQGSDESDPLFSPDGSALYFGSAGADAYDQISPDGRWLVWASDDSGRYEVNVAPFPGQGSRVQVSRDGGAQPRWSPAGREIFLKTPDNVLTAVRIETGSGTISVGTPTPLFPIVEFTGWTWDVSADGTRFLVREPLAEGDDSPITLLTDWTSLTGSR